MPHHDPTLELLEAAERDVRLCPACGEPTVLNARADGSIWLECSTLAPRQGRLRRLLTGGFPHFRREVIAGS
jgi:hypothetical protein